MSQQLIKAAKSRDMAGCHEALQQGADVFATDQAKSCVPKQTVQTSPRSLFSFANATNRCKWWASFHFYPLLFCLGKYVRACTLRAKTSSVTSVLPCSQLWPVWIHRFALGGQSWFTGSLQAATREGCWCSAAEDGKTSRQFRIFEDTRLNFSRLLLTCRFVSCLTS